LLSRGETDAAAAVNAVAQDLARRHGMRIVEADALALAGQSDAAPRRAAGYEGPGRP
jgi:hypothetical protein